MLARLPYPKHTEEIGMEDMIRLLAAELGQKPQHVGAVVRLLDEGNTIPFIARYRKEQHGAMDDTTLRTLAERLQYLRNLDQRREEIRRSIAAQEKLTDELDAALQAAVTLSELEDLYRPYKPKRRTRATIARERGLAPLAEQLLGQAGARRGDAGGRTGRCVRHRGGDRLRRCCRAQSSPQPDAAPVRSAHAGREGEGGGDLRLSALL